MVCSVPGSASWMESVSTKICLTRTWPPSNYIASAPGLDNSVWVVGTERVAHKSSSVGSVSSQSLWAPAFHGSHDSLINGPLWGGFRPEHRAEQISDLVTARQRVYRSPPCPLPKGAWWVALAPSSWPPLHTLPARPWGLSWMTKPSLTTV